MLVGEFVSKYLKQKGVEHVFSIPGDSILPFLEQLQKENISLIRMGHEQSLIHAAEGYSYFSGKVGVVAVTSGPGITNTFTGISNAYLDRHSVLVIGGQVPTTEIGTGTFQDIDVNSIFKKITLSTYSPKDANTAVKTINSAFNETIAQRNGPVVIIIPKDIWLKKTSVNMANMPLISALIDKSKDTQQEIKLVIEKINASIRPVVLIGQGANQPNISKELQFFFNTLHIPIVGTLHSIGACPTDNEFWFGMAGLHGSRQANFAIAESDLLIVLGARLENRLTGNPKKFAPHAIIIHVDLDKEQLGKYVQTDIKINTDIKIFLDCINGFLSHEGKYFLQDKEKSMLRWLAEIRKHKNFGQEQEYPKTNKNGLMPIEIFSVLNEYIKADDIIVTDCGQSQMWAAQFLKRAYPRQFLSTGGFGTMGFGLPAAIGASIAKPEKKVWLIVGDGGLISSMQELGTLSEVGGNVAIILINNFGYGMVRQLQHLHYNDNRILTEFKYKWQFGKIAEAFGLLTRSVSNTKNLRRALYDISDKKPSLIEVVISRDCWVYPVMIAGESNNRLLPQL